MTTLREAAQMALEALRRSIPDPLLAPPTSPLEAAEFHLDAIKSLHTALAQQDGAKSDNYLNGYCTGRTDLLKELQDEQEPVSVKFPRHAPRHGDDWKIDPAFLFRVLHSIDPDTENEFTPSPEQIETTLLALEVIPSALYLQSSNPVSSNLALSSEPVASGLAQSGSIKPASNPREWQGLTDEEIMEISGYDKQYGYIPKYARNFVAAIEAKLKEKNND